MLHRNARRFAGVLFCALLLQGLSGCATPPQTRALQQQPVPLQRTVRLDAVPYFAQELYQCGPATLAMTMNAAGLDTTPEALAPQIYLPGREGSLQIEMLAATRRHGLLAYTLRPRLADLLAEIAAGNPVLVLQNLAFNWWPRWHYAVAIGYDLDAGTLTLRSGAERAQRISLRTFEYTWQRGGHWALLTLPPDRIPATATEDIFLSAALALEQSRQTHAARAAYSAATRRWPQSFAAFVGLGNTAYALGNFTEAAIALRSAIALRPDSAIAHNNLADTLLQQNDAATALTHARRAVELGGGEPAFARTLHDIEAHIATQKRSTESAP
jgi:tetratricopeptide (TPR) repeat protein